LKFIQGIFFASFAAFCPSNAIFKALWLWGFSILDPPLSKWQTLRQTT
jgi:hypothetical protein